ncbi:hypothetical protein J6590_011703 [Homalodisca vitripennis]|nr:hypothetical protein J6590_011703 [Homalodisca vitripennis]
MDDQSPLLQRVEVKRPQDERSAKQRSPIVPDRHGHLSPTLTVEVCARACVRERAPPLNNRGREDLVSSNRGLIRSNRSPLGGCPNN